MSTTVSDYSDSMTPRTLTACAVTAVTAVSVAAPFAAQEPPAPQTDRNRTIAHVLETLDRVRAFHQTAISPDGRRVAWVEDVSPADSATAVFVRDVGASGSPKRVTSATDGKAHKEDGVAWSPDNRTLAFLSDAATPSQRQVYVVDTDGSALRAFDALKVVPSPIEARQAQSVMSPSNPGQPRRVTSVTGQLARPLWSPDGRQLAVLFVAGSTQETGALVAYKPDAGVVGDVVEEQRIAIVDLATGSVREVSPPNMYVYDYDWSPDGQAFAAEAVEGSGTNNYWIAQLYVVRAGTGATKSIWKPPLQLAGPRWSPDGKSIAVVHGIMSDEGQTGGDIYLGPRRGRAGEERHAEPRRVRARARLAARRPAACRRVRRRQLSAGHHARRRRSENDRVVRAAADELPRRRAAGGQRRRCRAIVHAGSGSVCRAVRPMVCADEHERRGCAGLG
jgi:hypothetical protein